MIKVGDKVVDAVSGLGVGEVIEEYSNTNMGPEPVTQYIVNFGKNDETGEEQIFDRSEDELKTAGTVFVDSRGAEMEAMSYSEALDLVLELASSNVLGDEQTLKDDNLEAEQKRQQTAVDMLSEFVSNQGEVLDSTYVVPVAAGDWPSSAYESSWDLQPTDIQSAIRICLDLGQGAMIDLDDTSRDIEAADEYDRQNQAVEIVQDLLGRHGTDIGQLPELGPRLA